MPAELSYNQDGKAEMFSAEGIVPWHKEGTIVQGKATAEEAIALANLNWTVSKTPLYVQNPLRKVTGFHGITRDDDKRVLGVVKDLYTIVQNERAFDFFDSIVGEGQAVYETAGALRDGAVIWIQATLAGSLFIGSDEYQKRVLLVTSHNGTYGLMVMITPVRVVCMNTLSAALSNASNVYKVRHCPNLETKIAEAQKALKLASAYYDNLKGVLESLQKTPMNKPEMEVFTSQLFPAKEEKQDDGTIAIPTRTANIRDKVVTLFERGQGNIGKSRYDALNAVTEYVDHQRLVKGKATRLESSLLGSGTAVKARALELLTN